MTLLFLRTPQVVGSLIKVLFISLFSVYSVPCTAYGVHCFGEFEIRGIVDCRETRDYCRENMSSSTEKEHSTFFRSFCSLVGVLLHVARPRATPRTMSYTQLAGGAIKAEQRRIGRDLRPRSSLLHHSTFNIFHFQQQKRSNVKVTGKRVNERRRATFVFN